jgi:cytochrome c peroxidase
MDRLEDQVRKSIETTMRGPAPAAGQVDALAAYLRSLSPPSAAPDGGPAVARGREVFRARECASCHAPPEYTTPDRYDVGLVDAVGNRKFNPPSLRAVGRREPLLHDGRARGLEEVFLEHRHPRNAAYSPEEVADLVAFLRTL